ncbi:GTPase Era [Ostreibacterium oceani]|uniref:GTPase Era n=1 Tax=Ostreibacterium oceani TaxID=2654998 RepID=A0A6N7EWY3_9GAMM|nr:GTPase Era [Ostreibacterium oceani]MPV85637.1 GTPase Era [Ostreibacterium oceani]
MNTTDKKTNKHYKLGYIGIVGRPNVGKSTLLNYILGEKLAITSRKPQTTRQNLLGIHTSEKAQYIFVDTPGLHQQADKKINQYMNKSARLALEQVDVIVHICDSTRWTTDDDYVLQLLKRHDIPVIAVLNKMDLLSNMDAIIPEIEAMSTRYPYAEIVPVSALKNRNVSHLLDVIANYLPLGDKIYPDDQLTTASMRFIASEIVREKLFKALHQELPYSIAVITDSYKEVDGKVQIFVTILLERASQKPIVVGKGGKIIKMIGTQARKELQLLLGQPVELRTWVKIKENWSDNDSSLQQLGLNQGIDHF